MFKLLVLVACVAGALGATISGGRIVGGDSAAPGQFPYQISMRIAQTGGHHCGGTIINNRFIVTAAHCVYDHYVSDFVVVVGSNYLNQPGQVYALENAMYHGGYDPNNMSNDIALLKTASNIQFTNVVQPLPIITEEVPDGGNMVLSGWGITQYPGTAPPNDLKYTYLTKININECAAALSPGSIFDTQICTFTRYGNGACQGDSGGPLVYNGQLAGVVSWGRPCAIGYPDVFTKASAYIGWINAQMQ